MEKASCRETVVQNAKMDGNNLSINSEVSGILRANLEGGKKKTDSPKAPFWTTVSPHDASSALLASSEHNSPNSTSFDNLISAS